MGKIIKTGKMLKFTLLVLIISIFVVTSTLGQVANVGSEWRFGNLVFFETENTNSLLFAIGDDVTIFDFNFDEWAGDSISGKTIIDQRFSITAYDTVSLPVLANSDSTYVAPLADSLGVLEFRTIGEDTAGAFLRGRNDFFAFDSAGVMFNILYFGIEVFLQEDSTIDMSLGFSLDATSILTDDTLDQGIYFRVQHDSATIEFVTETTGGVETRTTIGTKAAGTFAEEAWYSLKFYCYYDGVDRKVSAFLNNELVATHTGSEVPTTAFRPFISYRNFADDMGAIKFMVRKGKVIQIRKNL